MSLGYLPQDVFSHFVARNDVGVFHAQIEETDLVRNLDSIKNTFLDDRDLEFVSKSIQGSRSHTTAGGAAGQQEGVNMSFVQHAHEGRSKKGAAVGFLQHNIAVPWREFRDDLISELPSLSEIVFGAAIFAICTSLERVGICIQRSRVKNRNLFCPRNREEIANFIHCRPPFFTTMRLTW